MSPSVRRPRWARLSASLLTLVTAVAPPPPTRPLRTRSTRAGVQFGFTSAKAAPVSFAGHKHEVIAPVSGTVSADPGHLAASHVELTFLSSAISVSPEGEPEGDAPQGSGRDERTEGARCRGLPGDPLQDQNCFWTIDDGRSLRPVARRRDRPPRNESGIQRARQSRDRGNETHCERAVDAEAG